MTVDQVVAIRAGVEPVEEGGYQLRQGFLGHRPGRSERYVQDPYVLGQFDDLGRLPAVGAGHDVDDQPALAEAPGDLEDVDVQSAGVTDARRGQR